MKARKMQEAEKTESGVPMISLSVKPYGFASSPEGGAFWHLPVSTNKAPPSGELDATNGSGLRGFSPLKAYKNFPRSAALSQKAAPHLPFAVTTPPVKME